ncbi:hypothetical protein ACI65C_007035 [Semiaphis heraclei]
MGSTDSLDSGKDSALDEHSPLHDGIPRAPRKQQPPIAEGRRKRAEKYSTSSPPPVAAREHHNRSKSADCCGASAGDENGSRAKTHAKSLSVGDDSFDHKIQLWRKRADSQGSIDRKPLPAVRHQLQHHAAADIKGTGGAPDLVMDLPARTSGGAVTPQDAADTAAVQEPDSPDMGTAAERFAKQNQCTLKKYSKPLPAVPQLVNGGDKPELPPKSTKPPLKAKPQIFKKPVFFASGKANNDGPAPPHHP